QIAEPAPETPCDLADLLFALLREAVPKIGEDHIAPVTDHGEDPEVQDLAHYVQQRERQQRDAIEERECEVIADRRHAVRRSALSGQLSVTDCQFALATDNCELLRYLFFQPVITMRCRRCSSETSVTSVRITA